MTDRLTASTATDDAIDALYDRAKRAEAERSRHARLAANRADYIARLTADRDGLRTRLAEQESETMRQHDRAERAEAAIARVRAIPRLPHSSQRTGDLGRAYTRGWESVIAALDTALDGDLSGYPMPDPPIRCALPDAAPELDRLAESGVHTPGCDCGHDGMGAGWHGDDCAWKTSPKAAPKDALAGLREQVARTIDNAISTFDPEQTEDAYLAEHLAITVLPDFTGHLARITGELRTRAEQLQADLDRLEEETVGELNEKNIALARQLGETKAQLAELHEGEEPYTHEGTEASPAQWIWKWNRATPKDRLERAERIQRDAATAGDCRFTDHKGRLELAEHFHQDIGTLQRRADRLATTLQEVLGHLVHKGHPGEPCLSSGWISVKTVDRWQAALDQPHTQEQP